MQVKTKALNFIRQIFKIPILERWLRKKTNGKTSNNFIYKLTPNNYQYQKGSIREFNYNGINFIVDIHDYVGHFLYFGFKEQGQQNLIALAKTDDIILDIGTNIGTTILQFAKKIGVNGFVYGFEPDSFNLRSCEANIKSNSFNNIKVFNFGLGDEIGKFNLFINDEANRGCNRISFDDDTTIESNSIEVNTIDNWVESSNITIINLIKIDVEGFEYKVLSGGKHLLKKMHPTLFIELDNDNLKAVGDSALDVIELLFTLGYKSIYNAETNEVITQNYNFNNCHFDIVAKFV